MAEQDDEPETEAQEALEQANPAAVALALGKARSGAKLPPEAADFLRRQTRLIELQTEHLHEQRELQLGHLRVRRWKDRLSLALQVLGVVVGAAVALGLAVMVWQAHEDHGLVVEAFSVPPDLVQRGLSGQVVATQLLDKLSDMQAKTDSARPPRSYQHDWGEDAKVEIPDTGMTLGELSRWLRQWLGSQTRVSGEVFRTPTGLTISVRAGQDGSATYSGPDTDVDKLVQQAAEAVYKRSQPYRYALWMAEQGRRAEGLAAMLALADGPAGEDRSWADGVALFLVGSGDIEGALARAEDSRRLFPNAPHTWEILSNVYFALDREGADLDAALRSYDLLRRHPEDVTPVARRVMLQEFQVGIAEDRGDFQSAVVLNDGISRLPDYQQSAVGALEDAILDAGQDHDAAGFEAALNRARRAHAPEPVLMLSDLLGEVGLERWSAAAQHGEALQRLQLAAQLDPTMGINAQIKRVAAAWTAYAKVRSGDLPGAQALIGPTPSDCYTCIRIRGKIAASQRDWTGAERWFAEAVRQAPSIPFAYADWGAMLLDKGDTDGAIGKMQLARKKGPNFADASEVWGEALARKGDFQGSVERFADADKSAPRWGRNHLHWGEALARLGKSDEAKAQWRAAAGLELSAADRAELARAQVHG